jgi:hypothetical protein
MSTEPFSQRADASSILNACTAATWRPLVAWAAGVAIAQHAIHLYDLPIPSQAFAPESHGYSGCGRHWDATRRSFRIWEYVKPPTGGAWVEVDIVVLKWREIERLVTVDRIGEVLHDEIRTALHIRVERTPTWDPRRGKDWHRTAEAATEQQLWSEIEDECYRLGALAWAACKPVQKPVQLDLFSVVAA